MLKGEYLSSFLSFMGEIGKKEKIEQARRKLRDFQLKKKCSNIEEVMTVAQSNIGLYYDQKYSEVVEENTNLNEIIIHLNDAIASLQTRLDDANEQNLVAISQELRKAEEKIFTAENELASLKAIEKLHESTISRLEKNIEALEQFKDERLIKEQSFIDNYDTKVTDQKVLLTEIESLKLEREVDKTEIKALMLRIAELELSSKEHSIKQSSLLQKKMDSVNSRNDIEKQLIMLKNNHEATVISLEKQNTDLRSSLEIANNYAKKLEFSNLENSKLAQNFAALQSRNTQLLQENKELMSNLEELRQHSADLANENAKLISSLSNERNRIDM